MKGAKYMYLILRDCNNQLKAILSMKFDCNITESDRYERLYDVHIKTPISRIDINHQEINLVSCTGRAQNCPLSWFYKLELI